MLGTAYHWHFDAFKLEEVTSGRPLSALAFFLFQKEGLVEYFGIKPVMLARCGRQA